MLCCMITLARCISWLPCCVHRHKHEQLVQKARELDTEASSLKREAAAREKEIDQLRSLSVAGDATVQDCVAQLKVTIFPCPCL